MAARALQMRMASFLRPTRLLKDLSRQNILSASSLFSRYDFHIRGIQMQNEQDSVVVNPSSDSNTVTCHKENSISGSNVNYSAMTKLKTSSRHDLAMIFTCRVCDTRSMKTVCRESYEKGVVVVRCGGCDNLHLMADHLGWFGEPKSVEDFLALRGEEVKKGTSDTFSLTLEDLAGKNSP